VVASAPSTATVDITAPGTATGPVATTGLSALPQLVFGGLLALLAGILLLVGAALGRRPRRP
jgi:hypothetical protein